MIKKVISYIALFFCLVINIIIDINIKKYFGILKECFGDEVQLTIKLYVLICFIIAIISILIVLDIICNIY